MARLAAGVEGRERRPFRGRLSEYAWGYAFISPWLIGFFLLTLWPMVQSFYLSLTQYSLLESPVWTGFANYSELFMDDEKFRTSLRVTFTFVALSVPLKLIFALFVAIVLNKSTRGMAFFRGVYYLPSLLGASVAVSILWRDLFGGDGLFNRLLGLFGISGMNWINSPGTALYTLVVLAVWQFGSSMVIFLAGLKQIPRDLYEAAAVDGAARWRLFLHITLPMLTPIILFNLVMQTIGSFQSFTQAFVITGGGPINSTLVYALYLYQKAFAYFTMGYASAMAWVLLVIVSLFTLLIFRTSTRWVHYET